MERVLDVEFVLGRLVVVRTTNSKESKPVMIVNSCDIPSPRKGGIDPNHHDVVSTMFFASLISWFEPSFLLSHPIEGVLGTPCDV